MTRGRPKNREITRKTDVKVQMETIEVKNGALSREIKVEKRKRRNEGNSNISFSKLKFDRPEYQREGYKRYWPGDKGNRLDELYMDDYDYVLDNNGQKIKQFGGCDRYGNKFYHYLMEKPLDWYEEDKKKKREAINIQKEIEGNKKISNSSQGLNIYRPNVENNVALSEID